MSELKKKPLVEAIFEIKWSTGAAPGRPFATVDNDYSILVGRFYDRVREEYPAHERLPTSQLPDQLISHLAQHQFRSAPKDWPLLQLGPGLMTINETVKYSWPDFRRRAVSAVKILLEAHPQPANVRNLHLSLRYLDAIPYQAEEGSLVEYLRTNLKLGISLPEDLFAQTQVSNDPVEFVWQAAFASRQPRGVMSLKLGLGENSGVRSLILDTAVISTDSDAPDLKQGFADWADQAHEVTSSWFKGLTAGALYESFEPV